MVAHERRQHFRIDDYIYFDYKILKEHIDYPVDLLHEELLGEAGRRYLEINHYFKQLDFALATSGDGTAFKDPFIINFLNNINAKIDYLMRQMTLHENLKLRKVNISLGGMAFTSKEPIAEKMQLKCIIYTKPNMLPIFVNARVVYSRPSEKDTYRIAMEFQGLTSQEEQLLSQHIMLSAHGNPND